jgi:hypothetical protein
MTIPSLDINPLNVELKPICHLLALLGVRRILHVSRMTVNLHIYINSVLEFTGREKCYDIKISMNMHVNKIENLLKENLIGSTAMLQM